MATSTRLKFAAVKLAGFALLNVYKKDSEEVADLLLILLTTVIPPESALAGTFTRREVAEAEIISALTAPK